MLVTQGDRKGKEVSDRFQRQECQAGRAGRRLKRGAGEQTPGDGGVEGADGKKIDVIVQDKTRLLPGFSNGRRAGIARI